MTDRDKQILEGFVDQGFGIAKKNVSKDCNTTKIISAAYGFSEDQTNDLFVLLPWEDDSSKVSMLEQLGRECYDKSLTRVALLNGAVMKFKPDPVTDAPLTYPPGMRQECLTLTFIDFKDPNENFFKAHPYRVVDEDIVREEDVLFDSDKVVMDSLIMSCISFGFLKAAIFDEYQKREIIDTQFNHEMGNVLLKAILEKYPGAALGANPKGATDENN